MKPDLTKITPDFAVKSSDLKVWKEQIQKQAQADFDQLLWKTNEQISVKPLYTDDDTISIHVYPETLDYQTICRILHC
jgi:methylmalonyl-CoA mutase